MLSYEKELKEIDDIKKKRTQKDIERQLIDSI